MKELIITREHLEQLSENQLDEVYTALFKIKAYHLNKEGYIHYILLEINKEY